MATLTTGPSIFTEPGPTTQPQLDMVVARLKEGARKFVGLSLEQRSELARAMQAGYLQISRASVEAACAAKGIPLGTPLEGEEWTVGPWVVVRQLRLIRESLRSIREAGNTRVGRLGRTADQRLTVQVFPSGIFDRLLFPKVRVDVHLQAGVTEEEMENSRAHFYKHADHDGRVVLVLGGGNVNGIPSMDVVSKMFNEGKACILKMNPVNAYLGPYLEQAFADAIRQNYLAIVYGGSQEGEYLARHPDVDEVHLTGSDKTFDQIVWGSPGPERDARKAQGQPFLRKAITAELGNVSPVLILPGPYTDRQLAYQAEDVAAGLTFNAAFDCNANKVLILPKGWSQREPFLGALERALSQATPRKAYYPGAHDRWRLYAGDRRSASRFGPESEEVLPWTLVRDLDSSNREERAFASESFCPVLFETQVGSADPVEYLDKAVSFVNERLWGSLSAGLIVHPKTIKDAVLSGSVERAIANLRYGAVCVNAWAGYLFAFASPPWGAHPSSSLNDIQSGIGWVHNTPMLEGVEKAVLRHPLTARPKPAYFPSHRTAHKLMPRMTELEESGSWKKLPRVLAAAIKA
jgi:aldehyde dehydrogenase (NAD(P)+)